MPAPLTSARFSATDLAKDRFAQLGIDINAAIHVVLNYGSTSPGRRPNQHWYQGETPDGLVL